MAPRTIGLITCSQRNPRVGPQIAQFVLNTIQSRYKPTASQPTLAGIDLSEWNLPMMDEPLPPFKISSWEEYKFDHTKKWSKEIFSHSGFIFVTPQYNRGYPASVKNAVDYLGHEWKDKPAVIVSYGGRSAGRASATQLKDVLTTVGLKVQETMPALMIPKISGEAMGHGMMGEDIGLRDHPDAWKDEAAEVQKAFDELLRAVEATEKPVV